MLFVNRLIKQAQTSIMIDTRGVVYSAREAQMGRFNSNIKIELSYIGETLFI